MKIMLFNVSRVIEAKGGTEKVFADLCNALSDRGHEVTAVFCDDKQGEPGFKISECVKLVNLSKEEVPFQLSRFCRRFRHFSLTKRGSQRKKAILKFKYYGAKLKRKFGNDLKENVVICFQAESTGAIKSAYGNSVPTITMVHYNPNTSPLLNIVSDIFSETDVIQVLMPEYVDIVKRDVLNRCKVICIPNVVPQFSGLPNYFNKTILNVGRIDPGKRQHLLVEACAKFHLLDDGWSVELWGEKNVNTEYTNKIGHMINKYNLNDKIKLCGVTDDVYSKLEKSSIFCFPSESEGFPLALTEAMSIGLPSVGSRYASAVNKLIIDNENGILFDDSVSDLARALNTLIKDVRLREEMVGNAKKRMGEFSFDKILNEWEKLIYDMSNVRLGGQI